ncbi:NadS family protein, partial [Klebsiella pneumoniae]|uniref:NadS family protein n=1 Tax=Klebsiella pneumoniae TaxID=573 RepID=UPI0029E82265
MNFFGELKASLEEAVEIKNGVREPARVTRYELADVKAIRAQMKERDVFSELLEGMTEWREFNA